MRTRLSLLRKYKTLANISTKLYFMPPSTLTSDDGITDGRFFTAAIINSTSFHRVCEKLRLNSFFLLHVTIVRNYTLHIYRKNGRRIEIMASRKRCRFDQSFEKRGHFNKFVCKSHFSEPLKMSGMKNFYSLKMKNFLICSSTTIIIPNENLRVW